MNNGNIYTKAYLDRIKFPDKSGDEDADITFHHGGRIYESKLKHTMIYRWGMNTLHISGMGKQTNEAILAQADKVLDNRTGEIVLDPHFKNDYYIQSKILMMNENNYKVKLFNDTYNKISIFRNIQKRTGFVLDNLDFNNDVEFNIETEQWNYIKKLFRYTKDKPNNKAELKPIMISMIKSITNNNIIDSKQTRHKNIKERNYMLNMDFINEHLELDSYTNSNKQNYDIQFNNILNIKEDHIHKSYIGDIDKDLFND